MPADPQDALAATVAARGRQPNLSFFAFTATPKARTLELFGRKNLDGNYAPFHLYSMRQAIEEGFILDVLANYTTYATYWKVGKAVADDPEYDIRKARRSIARFVSLHPHNLAQKAEVIVEHFREHTRHKIGGRGQGDGGHLVPPARRPLQAGHRRLHRASRSTPTRKALVAFSGRVDDAGLEFTESGMNGFPESQTAVRFNEPAFGVLIVAEKFQTGYDQPLLHTMFVDKTLVGLAAVQTLSRLNRIHPEKTDTFVLDFRNEADDITEAFKPWYETTVAIPTDPNLLYDLADKLLALQVLDDAEARAVAAIIADRTKKVGDHGMVHALLAPAVERFKAKSPDEQLEVRDALDQYVRAYSFLSQVVDFGDVALEALYLASRALIALLPADAGGRLDLGSDVELTHLRLEKTSEGGITPDHGRRGAEGDLLGRGQEGRGGHRAPLDDHRGPQRAVRPPARHRRPAVLRPDGGDLARRRAARRPGPRQPHRELPPGVRRGFHEEHRRVGWTTTRTSSARSSTTRRSRRSSGITTRSGCSTRPGWPHRSRHHGPRPRPDGDYWHIALKATTASARRCENRVCPGLCWPRR